mgnify:CR=1 FL=1
MKVESQERQGVTIILVKQEERADGWFAKSLRSLYQSLRTDDKRYVAVDLSGTEYIDSSCISLLIEMLHNALSLGGCLALAGLSNSTREILKVTRLDRVIPVFMDIDSAVCELSQGTSS